MVWNKRTDGKAQGESAVSPDQSLDALPIDVKRRLLESVKTSATAAHSVNADVAGKLTAWIFAILVTLHAGGLITLMGLEQAPHFVSLTKGALFTGVLTALAGGIAAMDHYNSVTNLNRLAMQLELERLVQLNPEMERLRRRSIRSDKRATASLGLSFLCLAFAGLLAL